MREREKEKEKEGKRAQKVRECKRVLPFCHICSAFRAWVDLLQSHKHSEGCKYCQQWLGFYGEQSICKDEKGVKSHLFQTDTELWNWDEMEGVKQAF